jgi:hypothetical protein
MNAAPDPATSASGKEPRRTPKPVLPEEVWFVLPAQEGSVSHGSLLLRQMSRLQERMSRECWYLIFYLGRSPPCWPDVAPACRGHPHYCAALMYEKGSALQQKEYYSAP